jgi:hypothetical protein
MHYNLIEIRPNIFKDGEWNISNQELPHDREPASHDPKGCGFYYYPRRMGKKRAFERLKKHLIRIREDDIKPRLKEIKELKDLKYAE